MYLHYLLKLHELCRGSDLTVLAKTIMFRSHKLLTLIPNGAATQTTDLSQLISYVRVHTNLYCRIHGLRYIICRYKA